MASVNKWIGIGNLGADPETRYSTSGDAICNIRIACTDSWKDKTTGEKKESTEWVRVVFYRKLAEIADRYLKKGSSVYIEGRIKTRKWQDKDGQDRYTTEIEATEMQMLGFRQGGENPAPNHNDYGGYAPAPKRQGGGGSSGKPKQSFDDLGDDIPF